VLPAIFPPVPPYFHPQILEDTEDARLGNSAPCSPAGGFAGVLFSLPCQLRGSA